MTPFIIGWIIAIVAFIGIEAATIQLVSIWFMGGALAGMIAAMCGLGFVWQFGLFVVVSALLLAIFRPILRKKIPMPALPAKYWQRRAKFLLPGNSAQRQAPTWKTSCGRWFGMPDMTVIIM